MKWINHFNRAGKLIKEEISRVYTQVATGLLNQSELIVGNHHYRFAEIEFYLNSEAHPDLFTHSDPLQKTGGKWYFHRSGGTLKGGSFKGVDLTFGGEDAHGGILIRSIEDSSGKLIEGPSLCVDQLLHLSGHQKLADLDETLKDHQAFDKASPLFIRENPHLEQRPLFTSSRVGLSLKRTEQAEKMLPFIMRPYRFFTLPRAIKKGRVYVVLALYLQGHSPQEIHQLTGSSQSKIENYIKTFEDGKREGDLSPYLGRDLDSASLARLYGTWWRTYGK